MRHRARIFVTSFVLSFTLIAGAASAHVVVKPSQVGVAEFQTFTVSVPSEKDMPTTSLRLLIPSGVDNVTPTVKPGWKITTQKNKGQVSEIDWNGGSIPAGFRDDFTFSAQAPANATEIHWKAYQTYSDSSVVSWDASPAAAEDAADKGPYSTTKVINDLNNTSTQSTQDTNNNTPAYIISIVALALAITSLVASKLLDRTSKK